MIRQKAISRRQGGGNLIDRGTAEYACRLVPTIRTRMQMREALPHARWACASDLLIGARLESRVGRWRILSFRKAPACCGSVRGVLYQLPQIEYHVGVLALWNHSFNSPGIGLTMPDVAVSQTDWSAWI